MRNVMLEVNLLKYAEIFSKEPRTPQPSGTVFTTVLGKALTHNQNKFCFSTDLLDFDVLSFLYCMFHDHFHVNT